MDKWFVSRYKRFFEEAKRRLPEDAQVVIVGANDGISRDPTRQIWRPEWKGLFIEPNPQAVAMLQKTINPERDSIINCAVGYGFSNELSMWMMTEEAAQAYKKAKGDHGSALSSIDKDIIVSRLKKNLPNLVKKKGIDNLVSKVVVPYFSLSRVLKKGKIDHIDLIQIDVEGMENIVLLHLRYLYKTNLISPPRLVLFEHQHMQKEDLEHQCSMLKKQGYITEVLKNDTMAYRKDMYE